MFGFSNLMRYIVSNKPTPFGPASIDPTARELDAVVTAPEVAVIGVLDDTGGFFLPTDGNW